MLGSRIALLRRQAGLSQAELAKALQVSASAVGMYEQGRREPPLSAVVAMAELFGVSTDFLLTGKPSDRPDGAQLSAIFHRLLDTPPGTDRKNPLTREELAALLASVLWNP